MVGWINLLYQPKKYRMGLSISESAAERERIEMNTQKEARKSNRSENRSQALNQGPPNHHQNEKNHHEPPSKERQQPINQQKSIGKEYQARRVSQEGLRSSGNHAQKSSKIAIFSPNEQQAPYFQESPLKTDSNKQNFFETTAAKQKGFEPIAHRQSAEEEVHVLPQKEIRPSQPPKESHVITPIKIEVERLTEKTSSYERANKNKEEQNGLKGSGSKTLSFKKVLPSLHEQQPETGDIHHRGLNVEFKNFDWETPRHKPDPQSKSANKQLKPQSSAALISNFGKEEQAPESSAKKKWKNRREIMNQIVNDRLDTADGGFSPSSCVPQAATLQSMQQICS